MAELYSITGLFHQSFPGASPWGGFLLRGLNVANPKGIEGKLIDDCGPSTIAGYMDEKSLEFIKQYQNCNHNLAFDCRFSIKDGIWFGEYKSTSTGYSGKAVCKTYMVTNDLVFRKFDLRTPEGFAKALGESMVDRGDIIEVSDMETGTDRFFPPQ